MDRFAKFIRIISLAPIVAFVLISLVFFLRPGSFDVIQYALGIVFLSVLPLLAYPLQKCFPAFRDKGREGQRNLAMIFAVAGYISGIICALCTGVRGVLLVIYFTYLFSGLLIVLFNKGFKIKASGHACGVAGPVAVSIVMLGPWWYFGLAFLVLVFWACLRLKRHTVSQLIIGSSIPVGAMVLAIIVSGVIVV